jgi:hypothetical protein
MLVDRLSESLLEVYNILVLTSFSQYSCASWKVATVVY